MKLQPHTRTLARPITDLPVMLRVTESSDFVMYRRRDDTKKFVRIG